MVIPLHLGIEHPSLVWLGLTALLSFIAGMGVMMYRSTTPEQHPESSTSDSPDRGTER